MMLQLGDAGGGDDHNNDSADDTNTWIVRNVSSSSRSRGNNNNNNTSNIIIPPPSPSSSTASQYTPSVAGGGGSSTSENVDTSNHSAMFSSLSSNLMRSQQKRDPMVIYEVMEILGKGSMGSVSRVRKREDAVGGSARPQFVKRHYTPPLPWRWRWRGSSSISNKNATGLNVQGGLGCCPVSPFASINKNVFVDKISNTSDLAGSNRKKEKNHQAASSMSSSNTSPPLSNSTEKKCKYTQKYSTTCIRLRSCVGWPVNEGDEVNDESNIYCKGDEHNRSNKSTRHHYSNHQQPSSMILRNNCDKKEKRSSTLYYALKSIHLSRCSSPEYQRELKNEVEILKTLDHPNIVRAIETFDYRHRLFIVLELCNGGDLYTREPYTEHASKQICKSLFSAVAYLHSKDIIHRDLKFENVMFVNEKSDQVKLIDFGLSQKFASSQEQHLHDQVGTVYTMAPELLAGDYNNKADVWSLGVISFMLLSSSMPFYGKTHARVIHKILKGKYQFSSRRWNKVSGDAMRFVADCLTMKPEVRPSAEEALHLHWLSASSDNKKPSDAPPELDQMDQVQACMQAFAHYSMLKKLALLVVAYKSTSDEIGFLRGMFEKFDVHERGEISLSDFKEALSTSYDYSDFELEDIFHGIDVDGLGTIQYSEFLAATIEAHGFLDEERLAEAFDRIDADDDGYITVENLRDFLGNDVPATLLEEIIDEAAMQGTRRIGYREFIQLWNDEDDEILSQARSQVRSRHLTPQCSIISSVSSSGSLSELDEANDDHDLFANERAVSLATAIALKTLQDEAKKEIANEPTPQLAAIVKEDADVGAEVSKILQRKPATSSACFNQRKQMSITKSMRRTLVQEQPEQIIDDDTNDNDDGSENDSHK